MRTFLDKSLGTAEDKEPEGKNDAESGYVHKALQMDYSRSSRVLEFCCVGSQKKSWGTGM